MNDVASRLELELGMALDARDVERLERAAAARPTTPLVELAHELLVHETWFFRDPAVFEHLAEVAPSMSLPVRILSAPCSTGEEAYSVAIALARAGMPLSSFAIVGADLSARAIAVAEHARYSKRSFRGQRADATWLTKQGERWLVGEELRRTVELRCVNLLAPFAFADEPPFDVILCRNLLIYLTPNAQARLTAQLVRLLAPGGLLFLGQAESVDHPELEREGRPEHLAWRRLGSVREATPAPPPTPPQPPPKPTWSTESARRLADAGELDLALGECQRLLVERPADADVYALLGTVQHARGQRQAAIDAWRRAVYLDPVHPSALVHLGLALKAAGEPARAQALLQRAARAERG